MNVSGEKLKNAIRGKGLTIEDAAIKLGISRQALHGHLNKAKLSTDFLQNVKQKLKLDLYVQSEFLNQNTEEIMNRIEIIEQRQRSPWNQEQKGDWKDPIPATGNTPEKNYPRLPRDPASKFLYFFTGYLSYRGTAG